MLLKQEDVHSLKSGFDPQVLWKVVKSSPLSAWDSNKFRGIDSQGMPRYKNFVIGVSLATERPALKTFIEYERCCVFTNNSSFTRMTDSKSYA